MNSLLFLNLPNGISNALITIGTLLLLLLLSKTIFGWRHISSTKSGLITKKWSLKGNLENAKAEANIQGDVIRSARSIVISKNNADSIIEAQKGASKALELKSEAEAAAEKNVGFAKAEVTERQGQAVASAYEAQVKAMGQSGFTSLMVAEKLSSGNLQLVPQIMGGNSSDSMIGLLALKALGVELEQPKKVDNVK